MVEPAHWGGQQHLFTAFLDTHQPPVQISWEHESYEWMDRGAMLSACEFASDRYMNLAASYLRQTVVE